MNPATRRKTNAYQRQHRTPWIRLHICVQLERGRSFPFLVREKGSPIKLP